MKDSFDAHGLSDFVFGYYELEVGIVGLAEIDDCYTACRTKPSTNL